MVPRLGDGDGSGFNLCYDRILVKLMMRTALIDQAMSFNLCYDRILVKPKMHYTRTAHCRVSIFVMIEF